MSIDITKRIETRTISYRNGKFIYFPWISLELYYKREAFFFLLLLFNTIFFLTNVKIIIHLHIQRRFFQFITFPSFNSRFSFHHIIYHIIMGSRLCSVFGEFPVVVGTGSEGNKRKATQLGLGHWLLLGQRRTFLL